MMTTGCATNMCDTTTVVNVVTVYNNEQRL
jgi:hypothetical protein